MTISPEVATIIGGALAVVVAVFGWLTARTNRKADRIAERVDTVENTASTAATKTEENKAKIDDNSSLLLDLVRQQTDIQAASVELQGDMLANQRSTEAKQSAERETWHSSVDKMTTGIEALTLALTANNTLATTIREGVSALPKTIEETQKITVEEVNKHMDSNDKEITKRLDGIERKVDDLLKLVEQALASAVKPPPPAVEAAAPLLDAPPPPEASGPVAVANAQISLKGEVP